MRAQFNKYWADASDLLSQAHLSFLVWFWRVQIAAGVIFAPVFFFSHGNNPFRFFAVFSTALLGVWCLFLINRKNYLIPSLLSVYYAFGMALLLIISAQSLTIPVIAALPVVIIYSGWLFGQRQSFILMLLSILLYLGMGGYAVITHTSFPAPATPFVHAIVLSVYAIAAWFVGKLTEQSYIERTIQAEELAFHDPLTGLFNKRSLLTELDHVREKHAHNDTYAALLLVDIIDFQLINNALGHQNGDQLLQQVADNLLLSAGKNAKVARVSADVFAILLSDLGNTEITAVIAVEGLTRKIYQQFQQNFMVNGMVQHCAVNIGVTIFGKNSTGSLELMREADLALRESKQDINPTTSFFDPSFQQLASKRATMEELLRQALKEEQFELHYQPQISLDALVGVEALIRWRHPERGLIPPNEFIPIAEETGLIIPISDWVIKTACEQIRKWESVPYLSGVTVAVNISSLHIAQEDFVARVLDNIALVAIAKDKLKLELTEYAFAQDSEQIVGKMHELHNSGIRFSLDDFGTGYSCLSYLKRLPLDQIKIDRSFIIDLAQNSDDASITKTIINLAHAFELEVIAEGVETEEQKAFLLQHGCSCFQGYFFSRPLPVPELEAFAASWNRS
jgi:diguanylate cyclase (GGDEF) domain